MSRLTETTCVQLWSDGDRLYDVTRGADNCLTLKGPDGYSVDIQADHLEQVIDCLRRVAGGQKNTESSVLSDVQTYIDSEGNRRVILKSGVLDEDYEIRDNVDMVTLLDHDTGVFVMVRKSMWSAIRAAIDATIQEGQASAGNAK